MKTYKIDITLVNSAIDDNKLSIAQFAKLAGLTTNTINKILEGKEVTRATLSKISYACNKAYELTIEEYKQLKGK